MGSRNGDSVSLWFGGTTKALVMLTLCALSAACKDKKDPVGPDGPRDGSAVSSSVVATSVPPWMGAWVNALPPAAKSVWGACKLAETLNQGGTPLVVGTNCRMVRIDGYPRRYVVYVPNHPNVVAGNDVPLVVMYHGSSQNGEHFYNESGWRQEADANGFVVAFPSGLNYELLTGQNQTKWNSYSLAPEINAAWKPVGYPDGAPWPADDSKFTDKLLDDVSAQANIDSLRIFASGFSNGGGFVSRLAVEAGDRFASVAAQAGSLHEVHVPVERIPYFFSVGSRDSGTVAAVNAALQLGQAPITQLPLDPATLFTYATTSQRRDSLANTFALEPLTFSSTLNGTWTLMRWTTPQAGNLAGNDMWWGIIRGAGHVYPRGVGRTLPNGVVLGANNPAGFDAPRTFWNFFRTHTK